MTPLKIIHYRDSFSHELKSSLSVPECLNLILKKSPRWIRHLLVIRNSIVRLFGLKTEAGEFDVFKMKKNDTIGFVVVEEFKSQIAIFRGDDKHLSFRVLFEMESTTLLCSTEVQFHNIFGRIYFYSILPFHKMIIPRLLSALS